MQGTQKWLFDPKTQGLEKCQVISKMRRRKQTSIKRLITLYGTAKKGNKNFCWKKRMPQWVSTLWIKWSAFGTLLYYYMNTQKQKPQTPRSVVLSHGQPRTFQKNYLVPAILWQKNNNSVTKELLQVPLQHQLLEYVWVSLLINFIPEETTLGFYIQRLPLGTANTSSCAYRLPCFPLAFSFPPQWWCPIMSWRIMAGKWKAYVSSLEDTWAVKCRHTRISWS